MKILSNEMLFPPFQGEGQGGDGLKRTFSNDTQGGFTLVEVIATIVLSGIIAAMTYSYFGKSFVDSPKTVSNLNKTLALQAVMENITRDYTQNYAASDNDMLTMSENIGSAGSTLYDNRYGTYMVVANDFIKFSNGVETAVITGGGGCRNRTSSTSEPTNLLKVTIKQPDTGETLTALFTTGGASGSSGTSGCRRTTSDNSSDCACYSSGCRSGQSAVSVSVSPTSAPLAANSTQQFTASVSSCSSNQGVTWSVQETDGGTIDATGLYTAPSASGTYHIIVTSVACSNQTATATVTVGVSVAISPSSTSLTTGGTKQFTATVSGTADTSVIWNATGGTLSSTTSNPTIFTAPTTTGTYYVTATSVADPTKSATSTVTVASSTCDCMDISSVSINPTTASMETGASQQFTATVNGCSSNTGVTWSTTGGAIDADGLYTAPATTGTYTVKATSKDCSMRYKTVTVNVTGGSDGVSVTISPTTLLNEKIGCTKQFSATVTGSTDTSVAWSAIGGSVTSNGMYTAPSSSGTYSVTATSVADPTKSASATISVCSSTKMWCICQ